MGRYADHLKALTADQVVMITEVEAAEREFLALLDRLRSDFPGAGRELASAKTNLQQARFWAIEGITA